MKKTDYFSIDTFLETEADLILPIELNYFSLGWALVFSLILPAIAV